MKIMVEKDDLKKINIEKKTNIWPGKDEKMC